MKITFTPDEVTSAFVCKLKDIGLTNIDSSTVVVAAKALRDGSGSIEAEVTFSTMGAPTVSSCTVPTGEDPEPVADEKEVATEDTTNMFGE